MLTRTKLYIIGAATLSLLSMSGYALIANSGWKSLPVHTVIDQLGVPSIQDSDHGVSSTVDAMNSARGWNGAHSGIIEAVAGPARAKSGDGIYTIDFNSSTGLCTGGCVAVTIPIKALDGSMRDADTYTNQRMQFASLASGQCRTPALYIENTMVHEAGHALGLGHTNVHIEATMYPTEPPCETKKISVARDDVKGIQALYR
jgi:hypothetical protein